MASAKREPIWGSGGIAPSGVQGQSLYFLLEFTPLTMGSERSRVGTCPPVPPWLCHRLIY
jgi:hypothetical protein